MVLLLRDIARNLAAVRAHAERQVCAQTEASLERHVKRKVAQHLGGNGRGAAVRRDRANRVHLHLLERDVDLVQRGLSRDLARPAKELC